MQEDVILFGTTEPEFYNWAESPLFGGIGPDLGELGN